jgi:hypothetical protein
MTEEKTVFEFDYSVEDERPVIAFDTPANQGIDWLRLGAILRGERPSADYHEIRVVVQDPDASSWGIYSVPGTLGLISAEAVERIGRPVFRLYELLPAKINEADYYFLKPMEVLPCLDREKSEIILFRSNPSRVKEIRKYVFKKAMIPDPLVFSIPESLARLFATPGVYERVVQSRIPGFCFTPRG